MRVGYGFMAEKACKMPDGRAVAYGILGAYTSVTQAQTTQVMPVAVVVDLMFKNPGAKRVEARLLLPGGKTQDLQGFSVDAVREATSVNVILDGIQVPLSPAGKVKLEMRENGGVWHDAVVTTIVHPAPVLPPLGPELAASDARH